MAKKEYTRPDEAALLRVLANHDGTIVACVIRLAWTAGLSVNEIRTLTWDNISFATGEITLPKRSIPMDKALQLCLQERKKSPAGQACAFVIASDKFQQQMHRVAISYVVRNALDTEEALREVTLVDLRQDYVIRLLEQYDWPYVVKISGIKRDSLLSPASPYFKYTKQVEHRQRGTNISRVEEVADYEYKLWVLTQSEGTSPEGLAIWMIWQLGMQLETVVSLTWEQVDFSARVLRVDGKALPMGAMLERRLRQLHESRSPEEDPHVLLTPKSRGPFRSDRLSRTVTTVLIQNGLEEVDLGKLSQLKKRQGKEDLLMQCAKENRYITVTQAAALLQTTTQSARGALKKLEQRGLLTPVGIRYYLPETVVSPEKQEEVICGYLREHAGAQRKDLAEILGIEEKQCTWVLSKLMKQGTLRRVGYRYYLCENTPQTDARP